jgi:hypothetical protein
MEVIPALTRGPPPEFEENRVIHAAFLLAPLRSGERVVT